jgi:hypothetical protein
MHVCVYSFKHILYTVFFCSQALILLPTLVRNFSKRYEDRLMKLVLFQRRGKKKVESALSWSNER